jgi:diguanylate cyclase (GGDEF)-like protein/PAS domain S-box-containing protein
MAALVQREEALKESTLRYRTVADFTSDWEYWIMPDQSFRYISPSCEQISGYTRDEFQADPQLMKRIIHPDDQPRYAGHVLGLSAHGSPETLDYRIRAKDGEIRWISHVCRQVFDTDGQPMGRRASNRDITDRKRIENHEHQLALHDMLTKLPNRRLFNDHLKQVMAASECSGCFGALMFLDLDNFKPLNDLHGHDAGDLLLVEVSSRLKNCVRAMDMVARFGGDEFVVLLGELHVDRAASSLEAGHIAEKIRSALAEPYLLTVEHDRESKTSIEHHCTASIGVALFINHEVRQGDILRRADTAMYQAKEAGRNLVRIYDSNV